MASLHVIHLLKATGIAGAETHLLALLPALQSLGLKAEVLILEDPRKPQDELAGRFRDAGIDVTTIPIHGHIDPGLPGRVDAVLEKSPFQILHAHLPHGEIYGAFVMGGYPGKRLVITRHSEDEFRYWPLVHHLFWPSIRRADRMIAISLAVRSFMIIRERVPSQKIDVVPYGIDADRFAAQAKPGRLREELGLTDAKIIGFLGRLIPLKGVDILLRAFARVEAEEPNAYLAIAGDGPARGNLEKLARGLGLRRVHFLGWRKDPAGFLADVDVLAVPSRREGFGMVALEAMALGKPVVATRISALPEIVIEGRTGLLVDRDQPMQLAEALGSIIASPDRGAEFGRAGRKRALEVFSIDQMAGRTLAVYEQALAEA